VFKVFTVKSGITRMTLDHFGLGLKMFKVIPPETPFLARYYVRIPRE
jgi:hypothetical protein